ncbi:hypothetical protein AVO45_10340 [Ruegeria marisrubri]|uniref:HTH lysR-type domain-containing protein n=2 Tax=Ruegeria marisrubri TaxID=1685379 RepID=A0A0X3TMD9_9RHOB|nr:hypothetical protein AVO45_10340 [Ruegeria marisrubri]
MGPTTMQPKLRDPSFVGALVYFDRVAAHLNFSLAAQELGVTTSAVSHRIKRLEVALGQQLFRRDHSVVVLTEAGYRLRNASKEAFDILGRAIEKTTEQRSLRVSIGPFLSVTWLMPLLSEYEKIHQNVRVELVHHIGKPDFANTDLAIWWTEPSVATRHAVQLFSASMVPVARADFAVDIPVWEQDLPPLHYRTRKPWQDWLACAGGPADFAMQGEVFDDPNIVLEAAAHGRGIALGFAPFANALIKSGRLRAISEFAAPSPLNYFLFSEKDVDKDVAAFRVWLLEQAQKLP